nr:MAG TPA: baseplate wedge protein [Bacteriophage sp.]
MIKDSSLSFEELKKDAVSYVQSLPEDNKFKDFYLSSQGAILIDLLAGFATWSAFKYMNNRGESYLEEAKLRSSVVMLAKSKGIYLAPAKTLTVEATFKSKQSLTIRKGEQVGDIGIFTAYSLDDLVIEEGKEYKIKVAIGKVEKVEYTANSSDYFQEIEFKFANPYICDQIEEITVNDIALTPVYNPQQVESVENTKNHVLRYVSDNKSILTFGNSVLGRHLQIHDNVTYKVLTYNDTLLLVDPKKLSMMYGDVTKVETLIKPSKYLSTEDLRRSALFTSVNGTLIVPSHYESAIIHRFGQYLHDIYVEDDYPADTIHYLPNELFTESIRVQIVKLVEDKKGTAVLVKFNELKENSGVELSLSLDYTATNLTQTEVNKLVDNFIKERKFKIYTSNKTITTSELVTDLNKETPDNIRFYLNKEVETLQIKKAQFIKNITVSLRAR